MRLPQRLQIEYIPVDETSLAEIEIAPYYECDQHEVLELLLFATYRLADMLDEDLEAMLSDSEAEED